MNRASLSTLRWIGLPALLLLASCTPREEAPDSTPPADTAAAPADASRPLGVLGQVPEFTFTDEHGDAYGSDDLHGKIWVANFIFTRCRSTCPVQTRNLGPFNESLQEVLPGEGVTPRWSGIRIVSITVDPEFDSPEVLAEYAAAQNADSDHWKFLTSDRESIWNLAKQGFHLPVESDPSNTDMPILHDSKFVLVDRMGRIRGYYDGLAPDDVKRMQQDVYHVMPEITPPDQYAKIDLPADLTHITVPSHLSDVDFMEEKRAAQEATRGDFDVFVDFGFEDRVEESGITFVSQIVDEQRYHLRVNHYDHGYGVSIADVDGDGLSDIYFLTQVGSNELWRNVGGGRFENITEAAGVAVDDRISVSGVFGDVDNDGDADLYVTTVRQGNLLFLNDGKGNFTDATAASGLGHVGHSSCPVLFDYDRDGLLDVFLTNVGQYSRNKELEVRRDRANSDADRRHMYFAGTGDAFSRHLKPQHAEESILFRNQGNGVFEDVTHAVGLVDSSWTGDATPMDVNGDGWLDLYVCNMQGHDEFYENQGGEKFVKKSREYFPKTPWGAMSAQLLDFENDGDFDLYLTDMHSDMSIKDLQADREKEKSEMQWPESFLLSGGQSIFGNAFYTQDGNTFSEVSDRIGAENYWPWGLTVADVNADGWEDAFLTSSMCFPFRYGANSLLLNNRGEKFLDAEFLTGVEPRPDGRVMVPWFELDASGQDSQHALAARREGQVMVWAAIGSRSSVIFDLDDDGDLDIVTNDFNTRPMVLVSDLAEKKSDMSWVAVDLEGTESNRDGLGAVVRVTAGGRTYAKPYHGKSGYLSQSLYPLYFGLDGAAQVDRIEVTWPSGKTQTVAGPIDANQRVPVRES